jgi:hypothetical protein
VTAVSWLSAPLFNNAGGASVFVGIDQERHWWLRCTARGLVDRDMPAVAPAAAILLLPLMAPGYGGTFPEMSSRLAEMLGAHSMPRELASTFPFHAPVLFAYREMTRWADLASAWIDEVPLKDDDVYALADSLGNRALSQAARQAASRRIHQWERMHGVSIVRRRDA